MKAYFLCVDQKVWFGEGEGGTVAASGCQVDIGRQVGSARVV